jgi:hypothetical protein
MTVFDMIRRFRHHRDDRRSFGTSLQHDNQDI